MSTIGIILLVAFVIVCILLVLLVLVQNEEGGMGGLLSGAGTAAFGSHSAGVLTKNDFCSCYLLFCNKFRVSSYQQETGSCKGSFCCPRR
jgi:preprotein translocase subunit SecG